NKIISEPDELIVEKRGRLGGGAAVPRLLAQALGNFGATIFECAAQDRRGFGGKLLSAAQALQPIGDCAPVDDRAAVLDIEEVHVCRSTASLFNAYSCSNASRGERLSGSIVSRAERSGSGVCSASAEAANSGKSSRPAAMPPVASRPASSLASTDFARATTAGGRPASLATAMP